MQVGEPRIISKVHDQRCRSVPAMRRGRYNPVVHEVVIIKPSLILPRSMGEAVRMAAYPQAVP